MTKIWYVDYNCDVQTAERIDVQKDKSCLKTADGFTEKYSRDVFLRYSEAASKAASECMQKANVLNQKAAKLMAELAKSLQEVNAEPQE